MPRLLYSVGALLAVSTNSRPRVYRGAKPAAAVRQFIPRASQATPLRLCCALILLLVHTLIAEDVIVRTQLSPEKVWVGQRMQLQIDVLGKDGWAQIADLSEVEVPGSYVRPSGNSRVRLNETIDGASYTGQRYQLSIYPQRVGEQMLPPIELKVRIQTWGAQNSTREVSTQTEAIIFTTQLPEGSRTDLPLIVSPKFTATQQWEPNQNEFTVGGALKRSITLRAVDLPAMVLPPLREEQIDGLSAYPESPQLREEQSTAIRTESATYVFEHNATPKLPSYQFQWWHPETQELQTITLDGRQLSITGGGTTHPLSTDVSARHLKITPMLLTVFGIGLVFFIYYRWKRAVSDHVHSEAAVFKQVTHALRNESPNETLNALLRWLDYIEQSPSPFFAKYADTTTQAIAQQLLSNPQAVHNLKQFSTGLSQARKHHQQSKPHKLSKADAILPPLNL